MTAEERRGMSVELGSNRFLAWRKDLAERGEGKAGGQLPRVTPAKGLAPPCLRRVVPAG